MTTAQTPTPTTHLHTCGYCGMQYHSALRAQWCAEDDALMGRWRGLALR